ncbi:hypothetical protein V9T40_010743 [Parthenolecanium corni]|uniref:Acyltransferase n=1 Tax=Parthenolecanium corni TaxID=536013 RepID=A0AAN9XXS3_9HEMI
MLAFPLWPILMYINFKLSIFLAIAYYSWILYDFQTPSKGGKKINWVMNLCSLDFIRDYFPIRLIKTAELPSDKSYLMAVFPHGVAPVGVFLNAITEINKISELYPGLDVRAGYLNVLFYFPIIREFLLALGSFNVSKETIKNLLESNPPKMIGINPGGVKDMLINHPGSKYKIVKENRKGFVKIALETGTSLVPVFSFGEQNLYDQIPISTLPGIRFVFDLLCKFNLRLGICIPLGRGIFLKKFGILPRRHPVTTVIGKPIPVPKVENPSSELIDEYHQRFHEALRTLFEENKRIIYWFRNLCSLDFVREYFPIRLIKTAELSSDKSYLMAVFPHAVLPVGVVLNAVTEINKVSELYPGFDVRVGYLNVLFYFPIIREFLLALGGFNVNKETIKDLLESNPPKMIGINPGGLKDMLNSHPGSKYKIVKENRKGFVKIALETGTSLVPVFSFGEQNLYDQIPISTLPGIRFVVDLLRQFNLRLGICIPFGRGIFLKKFGLLPRRHPATTVVGKPIPVPKVENPSSELIDEYHQRFHEALRTLFEENKRMYDEFGDEATLEAI